MCHVLIIEDEMLIAMHIQELLEDLGAETFDFAATELEAVEIAKRRAPALITSDVRLLEGTGPAAVSRILEEVGPTPVIYITGNPLECEPRAPDAPVLAKPVLTDELRTAFRSVIAGDGRPREARA